MLAKRLTHVLLLLLRLLLLLSLCFSHCCNSTLPSIRAGQALVIKTQSGRELKRLETKANALKKNVNALSVVVRVATASRDPLPGAYFTSPMDTDSKPRTSVDSGEVGEAAHPRQRRRRPATTPGAGEEWRQQRRAHVQVRVSLVKN